MRQGKYNWRYMVVCVLLVACNTIVHAQNISFITQVSANKIGAQDQLQVNYVVSNGQVKNFIPPDFKDFQNAGGPFQSSSSSTSYVNGQVTSSNTITVTYILRPKRIGNLMVPPATVLDAGGHSYQSNPINVQVVSGSLMQQHAQGHDPFDDPFAGDPFAAHLMQQNRQLQHMQQQQQQQQQQAQAALDAQQKNLDKDIFIKVSVDKNKVHVGEQITTSYKLYARLPMQVGISKLPSLNGFWTQDFELPKIPKPVEETVNGKKYQVFLLKKSALFPQQTGTLELDPAEADGIARLIVQVRRNPFADMFDDPAFQAMGSLMMNDPFFNANAFNSLQYKDVKVHLKSTPVKITVTPLPDNGKPADFTGAVGNFAVSGTVDKQNVTTDDAVTYKLKITGSGNLKLIEPPKLNLPNGLDTYDPVIVDTITGRTTTISGSKIIIYTITPHTPGNYTIPAVPFSYYNTQTGSYVSTATQPIQLHVTAGKHYNPATNTTNVASLKDIHDIVTKPLGNLSYNRAPLLFSPVYWSLYAVPLFAFIGILVWKRRDDELSKDTVLLRNRRANKVALRRLATAQKLLQQNSQKPFYEEVSKAIWLYLSDKLNIPLASLSRESAELALSRHKVPDALRLRMEQVITECETSLYAPTGGSKQMEYTYREAVDIISKLEEVF